MTFHAIALVAFAVLSGCIASDVDIVIATAREQIGLPYVWGGGHGLTPGKTMGGFGCSGLVRYAVWKGWGIDLGKGGDTDSLLNDPHTEQISCSSLQAGDLVFWGTREDVYHVALYSGSDKMIEAQRPFVPVHEVPYRAGDLCARVRP